MIDYDPTDTSRYAAPAVGVATWVTIGQGEETKSHAGNNMLVVQVVVNDGEEGAGYKTKEYLVEGVNWKIRQVLRACGLDPDVKHPIDDIFFRDRQALVKFKAEEWTNSDGETRTSYKIDEWVDMTGQDRREQENRPEPEYADKIPF